MRAMLFEYKMQKIEFPDLGVDETLMSSFYYEFIHN